MMKKLLLTCILILSLFGLTSAATMSGVSAIGCKWGPVFGPDLVTNGGMEDGNPPTNWDMANYPDTYERSGTQKQTGSYSYRIVEATNAVAGFGQTNGSTPIPLTFVSGKTYNLMFWYYLVSGRLRLTISYGEIINYYYYYENTETPTSISINFTATGTTETKGVWFTNASETGSEFYIDDVSIREIQ